MRVITAASSVKATHEYETRTDFHRSLTVAVAALDHCHPTFARVVMPLLLTVKLAAARIDHAMRVADDHRQAVA